MTKIIQQTFDEADDTWNFKFVCEGDDEIAALQQWLDAQADKGQVIGYSFMGEYATAWTDEARTASLIKLVWGGDQAE